MASRAPDKMGFNATWSMAVGGMVGGGIFSVLGVVVHVAGPLAWLSFVFAGVIALITGFSYVHLTARYEESGGAFTYLRRTGHPAFAGILAWVLILGYVLTLSVYAFTFGHYLAEAFGLGGLFARGAALAIVLGLVGVNLLGISESAGFEIVAVWAKLAVLAALAGAGLWLWHPERLSTGVPPGSLHGALIGAATIFMGYEGFQLLAYDYHVIHQPRRTLLRAVPLAIVVVIGVYVAVALGTASLVGADTIVRNKDVSLAIAGRALLGQPGVWAVSAAAAFSTGSAINATLFATARLVKTVAAEGELPAQAARLNRRDVPDRAVLALGGAGAVLAMVGSLAELVSAASLTFLFTFAIVNAVAFRELAARAWKVSAACGTLLAGAAALVLMWRLAVTNPLSLGLLGGMVVVTLVGRPIVVRRSRSTRPPSGGPPSPG